jgi:hypothetical protein
MSNELPSEVSETASSKGLLTAVALLFLGDALTAWSGGKALSDQRVYAPAIIAVAVLLVAYSPSERLKTARIALSTWASSIWVWAALFAMLWLYFAVTSITERQMLIGASSAVSETNLVSGWPLPSKTDISDLADDLRPYQPDWTTIIYDDAQEEPLVLAFAKAMRQANWKPPGTVGQLESPRLGIEIYVGSELAGALEPLKKFCRKQLKTEPTILTAPQSGNTPRTIQITIGHNEAD